MSSYKSLEAEQQIQRTITTMLQGTSRATFTMQCN